MLRLEYISKQIDNFKINQISLNVEKGDYFIISGESGSGKTSVLEIIAGIKKVDSGQIYLQNENITKQCTQKRQIGLVFQNLALFPHLNTFENIAYPLQNKRFNSSEIKNKVHELAEINGIAHILNKRINRISGGEQQRVALARILAMNPKVLLLDEPLNSVDIQRKNELCSFFRKINRQGQTIVHVTHDFDEAISLGSHIAVMKNGSIVQQGNSNEIISNPKSKFLANFIGRQNFYEYQIDASENNYYIANINNRCQIKIPKNNYNAISKYLIIPEEKINISLNKIDNSELNFLEGTIIEIIPIKYGIKVIVKSEIDIVVQMDMNKFKANNFYEGQKVYISFPINSIHLIN